MTDITSIIQIGLMFGTGIFFSGVAIDRGTVLTNALAGIIWLVIGVVNFIYAPTGQFTYGVSMLFWIVSIGFFASILFSLFTTHLDKKGRRWEVGPQ